MNRIDVKGLGVFIEIYPRQDNLTHLEVLKEAHKAIGREVLRYESTINNTANRKSDSN